MGPCFACLQATFPSLGVGREGCPSGWHCPTTWLLWWAESLGAPGPTPFPLVSVPPLVRPHTLSLSPGCLPPEEGLRGDSPLPRSAPHSAHGNEKHIGFIILD